jgi:preprotein translocase subunit SecF
MDTERAIAANAINKFLTCFAAEFVSEFFAVVAVVEFGELGLIKLIGILIVGFLFLIADSDYTI